MGPLQLRLEQLTVRFGGIVALQRIDVAIDPGEIVAVVGALGAGKSTLLRAAGGVLRPDEGRVLFGGAPLDDLAPGEVARRGVVLVPAGGGIFPTLTVRENLELAGHAGDPFPSEQVRGLFTRFPILAARPGQPAGSLSGGEQRQLAMARAALIRPHVLLLDEPLLGLAPLVSAAVAALVRDLAAVGTAVLLAEERPTELLSSLATRMVGLQLGRVIPAAQVGGGERSHIPLAHPRTNERVEVQTVRIPMTVTDKRSLQTRASAAGITVGELIAGLAHEHAGDVPVEVDT